MKKIIAIMIFSVLFWSCSSVYDFADDPGNAVLPDEIIILDASIKQNKEIKLLIGPCDYITSDSHTITSLWNALNINGWKLLPENGTAENADYVFSFECEELDIIIAVFSDNRAIVEISTVYFFQDGIEAIVNSTYVYLLPDDAFNKVEQEFENYLKNNHFTV